MRRKRLSVLITALVFVNSMGLVVLVMAMGSAANIELPYRETSGDINSPDISFIDSASPTCYQPIAGTGACYIQWDYLGVSANSGTYVISMTVTIDDHIRAYHSGFFQSSMLIPSGMTDPGYKVACGLPGSGGTANWGNIYTFEIHARESTGLTAANYGSVTCPADIVSIFIPIIVNR